MRTLLIALAAFLVLGAHQHPGTSPQGRLSTSSFRTLMERLAGAWNAGDAAAGAALFTEDAVYGAPPNPRVRRGRPALFEFFGGEHGRPRPMKMQWHHLVFDEEKQIGAGEYTFEYEIRTHGVAMVQLVGGRIARWREYEVESPLDWEKLAGETRF